MSDDIKPILDRFAKEIESWLDSPSETSSKLEEMKKQIEAMKSDLGAENMAAALKAFDAGDKQLRRQRQQHAAASIADALRPLGIKLDAKIPPRKPRKRKFLASNSDAANSSDKVPATGEASPPSPSESSTRNAD